VKLFFDNGHQHVNGNCYPDLGIDGILGGSVKRFDTKVLKVLFGPLEEDLDLPATLKQFGNGQCW